MFYTYCSTGCWDVETKTLCRPRTCPNELSSQSRPGIMLCCGLWNQLEEQAKNERHCVKHFTNPQTKRILPGVLNSHSVLLFCECHGVYWNYHWQLEYYHIYLQQFLVNRQSNALIPGQGQFFALRQTAQMYSRTAFSNVPWRIQLQLSQFQQTQSESDYSLI